MRRDLVEICCLFYLNNNIRYLTIPTNGYFTDKIIKDVKRLIYLCPTLHIHISLSLDYLWNRDKKVEAPYSLAYLVKTCELLKEFPITIGVITTQTSDNEHNLMAIYHFAKDLLQVDNFGFNIARITDKPNPEIYRQFTEMLSKTLPNFPFPINYIYKAKRNLVFKYVYKMITDPNPKRYMPCYADKKRLVIDETGDTHPCEMKMLGINRNTPINECYCQHECDMGVNILYNPRFIWQLIKEVVR